MNQETTVLPRCDLSSGGHRPPPAHEAVTGADAEDTPSENEAQEARSFHAAILAAATWLVVYRKDVPNHVAHGIFAVRDQTCVPALLVLSKSCVRLKLMIRTADQRSWTVGQLETLLRVQGETTLVRFIPEPEGNVLLAEASSFCPDTRNIKKVLRDIATDLKHAMNDSRLNGIVNI